MSRREVSEAEITVLRNTEHVRIYGVTYSLALFRALAARVDAGTVFDVVEAEGGKLKLFRHTPGSGGAAG